MKQNVIQEGHQLCVEFVDKVRNLMLSELGKQIGVMATKEDREELTASFSSEYEQILQHVDIIELCIKCIAE